MRGSNKTIAYTEIVLASQQAMVQTMVQTMA